MADPSWTDPTNASAKLGLLALVVTTVLAPFKVFQTRKSAESMFVKKVEENGTRAYVHPQEWIEMRTRMDKSIEQGEKWQAMAKDWMEHP